MLKNGWAFSPHKNSNFKYELCNMKSSPFAHKLFRRSLVVFILHLVIKVPDTSFPDAFSLAPRSLIFSLGFMLYGLGIWFLAEFIYQKFSSEKGSRISKSALIWGCMISFGFGVAMLITFLYKSLDQNYFPEAADWDVQTPLYAEEFFMGVLIQFLLVYGFHEFYNQGLFRYRSELRSIELKKENISSQYAALKNQIDPHFFFNSLSVLNSLVFKDAEESSKYIGRLSHLYRYLLERRDEKLVSLATEVEHLKDYIYLMQLRHVKQINFFIEFDSAILQKAYLPPQTLQLLTENAVKHNKFTSEKPMEVLYSNVNGYLVIANSLDKKEIVEASTGIGLENIKKRYKLLVNKELIIEESENQFIVKLPILDADDKNSIDI